MTTLILKKQALYFLAVFLLIGNGCKEKKKVEKQDVPETITKVELTFTDTSGKSSSVKATSDDPDGDGAKPRVTETIQLSPNKEYQLTISLYNGLLKPTDAGYDVTKEVEKEGEEHQFYFAWTNGLFSNPTGDGNADNPNDPMNYMDKDEKGLPVGLSTKWTTGAAASGNWTVKLKHQPDVKSATSTLKDGDTDLDIVFPITIK